MDDLMIDVVGRPATYGTRGEQAWRAAVTAAAGNREVPGGTRFWVAVEFRLTTPQRPSETWDLGNLIKPTLDALGGAIGWRRRRVPQEADDERIDRLVGSKPNRRGRTTRNVVRVGAILAPTA